MSPGLFDEVGSTARSIIDALKSTPVVLSLLLMNFGLLIFLFWYSANMLEQRKQTTVLITGMVQETNKMLASCVSEVVIRELIESVRHGRELQQRQVPTPIPVPQNKQP